MVFGIMKFSPKLRLLIAIARDNDGNILQSHELSKKVLTEAVTSLTTASFAKLRSEASSAREDQALWDKVSSPPVLVLIRLCIAARATPCTPMCRDAGSKMTSKAAVEHVSFSVMNNELIFTIPNQKNIQ
ncbi:hypothetical protein Trydic_g23121 [Trypoxylus dichotomus]